MARLARQPTPDDFLELYVHDPTSSPGKTGASVGYEQNVWRCEQFADHILEWLPEFALSPTETDSLRANNAVTFVRKAARSIYATGKYQRRGEFGEILLHILMRQSFHTIPAISKIYYKDNSNETVKGFDAVHVLNSDHDAELELWLGEAKFYQNITTAIKDVMEEIRNHTEHDYLRQEFALIGNKVNDDWPSSQALKDLIHRNRSLDEVFARMCIPVLLTYDSPAVNRHNIVNNTYVTDFIGEINQNYSKFRRAGLPNSIRVHLFLLPLKRKSELVEALHKRLRALQ